MALPTQLCSSSSFRRVFRSRTERFRLPGRVPLEPYHLSTFYRILQCAHVLPIGLLLTSIVPPNSKHVHLPTPFQPSDLKQQLKHADVQSLCMAATADKAAYETHIRRREGVVGVKGGGSMSGMAQDFRQLASMGSRDVRGRAMEMVAAVRGALGGRTRGRAQLR